jgi:hypothetical protein
MKNYKYFLFDLDRTLWDFDKNAKTALFKLVDSQRLGELFGVTDKEEFFQKYEVINQGLWRQYEKGEIQKEELRCNRFLFTLQQIRDEAHRFGITFHRKLRSKSQIVSALSSIKGVGEKTEQRLLLHFGSVARIAEASQDELAALVGRSLADRILNELKNVNDE